MESLLKDEGRWLITASDRLPPRHFSAGPLQRTTSQTTRRRILQCPSFNVEPIPIRGSGKEAARSSLSCANTHTHTRTHVHIHVTFFFHAARRDVWRPPFCHRQQRHVKIIIRYRSAYHSFFDSFASLNDGNWIGILFGDVESLFVNEKLFAKDNYLYRIYVTREITRENNIILIFFLKPLPFYIVRIIVFIYFFQG